MPSSRFKMHLLDYLVYSIISILCSRENNFNLLHLARIEENSITLFFSTDSSSSITIIEINSSTVLDYLVFASSFIYVKANVEGMILICKEKLPLLRTSAPSSLEFSVYLIILIRPLHAGNFLSIRFDFAYFCICFSFLFRFKALFYYFNYADNLYLVLSRK